MSEIRQEVLRMKLLSYSFDQVIRKTSITSGLEIATDTVAKLTNFFNIVTDRFMLVVTSSLC